MTSTVPATTTPRQAERRSAPRAVSGKLKDACLLLIFGDADGKPLEYDECARQAGLSTRAMRLALGKAHVRRFLRDQRALLVASYAANNPLHVAQLRAASTNQMVRLAAARELENMAGAVEVTNARTMTAGVTIVLTQPQQAPTPPTLTLIGTEIGKRDE
jgi:hypothetical protein